jgi:hypothetical protein
MLHADKFFATARERYSIMIRRCVGMPKPWTDDKVFQMWRFCNVHREDDKTTAWFRENIRSKVSGLKAIKATIAFRWFCRIEAGETIKDLLLDEWNGEEAFNRLNELDGPVVTGAYIIMGEQGYDKLTGVIRCIDKALNILDRNQLMVEQWISDPSLENCWMDLVMKVPYLGRFMAYEVVSDLRWTDVLDRAHDINTWANPGPGCARGLGRVVDGNHRRFTCGSGKSRAEMLKLMTELLEMSRDPTFWPSEWIQWEMREVEHWACEFDKYMRAEGGDRMKRRFR